LPDTDPTAAAAKKGAVYVQTNEAPNAVRVFYRGVAGRLTAGPVVLTGGDGSTVNPPFGLPVTDSQNSVVLTNNNKILLVTNSGTNTISSFRVLPSGNIVLADQKPSGGDFPISIATTVGRKTLVYVLNENSQTVSGLRLDNNGILTPIPDSTRSVTGQFSATVDFDTPGHVLTVTTRGPYDPSSDQLGSISTFKVDRGTGLLGPEVVTLMTPENSGTGSPFGFDVTRRDQLIVAESGFSSFNGTAASFDLWPRTAEVTPISSGLPVGQITCWVKLTKNNKYAYFTNPGTTDIARVSVSPRGMLSLLGSTPTHGSPLDLDVNHGGQYLYVLATDVNFMTFAFGDSRVLAYDINPDGSLRLLGETPAGSGGTSGLAAY